MSLQGTEGQPRWWRRSRDLSLQAAREARVAAAEAFFDLDKLHRDLPALMSAHRDAVARTQRADRVAATDAVTRDWQAVASRVDEVIEKYLELDGSFSQEKDYEESQSVGFRSSFHDIATRLRSLIPEVERFRSRHEDALLAAHNKTLAVPRAIGEAKALLSKAQTAYQQAQAQGFTDSTAVQTYREAAAKVEQADAALSRKEWALAASEAAAGKAMAQEVAERLLGLVMQAQEVRQGYASVRTRREALQTKHDRLPPVMSELRRNYSYGSWKHLDDAPKRIDAAMETVNAGLRELESALDKKPLDVPAAAGLLRKVRAAASDVESILRSASDTLTRLGEVSANPETLLVQVRRKTLDARRFLSGMPPEKAQRFFYTFDNIAARTDRLVATTKERHPDWGAVIAEAESIENALDAMIRTARSSLGS